MNLYFTYLLLFNAPFHSIRFPASGPCVVEYKEAAFRSLPCGAKLVTAVSHVLSSCHEVIVMSALTVFTALLLTLSIATR